jgi:hypothetical protein
VAVAAPAAKKPDGAPPPETVFRLLAQARLIDLVLPVLIVAALLGGLFWVARPPSPEAMRKRLDLAVELRHPGWRVLEEPGRQPELDASVACSPPSAAVPSP